MDYENQSILASDPYNPKNTVLAEMHTYYPKGHTAVTFKQINGEPVDLVPIKGTPMIQHPLHPQGYDLSRSKSVTYYKKYDGVNVFAYQYEFKGEKFVTYRSRFHPFFHSETNLKILWDAVLEKYPTIHQAFDLMPECKGFSFEMYGSDYPRLFQYDVEIDAVLLFAVGQEGEFIKPHNLLNSSDIPKAYCHGHTKEDIDYGKRYFDCQDTMQKRLYKVSADSNRLRPKYEGDSGNIWYIRDKVTDQIHMVKCEPPELEEVPMPIMDTPLSYASIRSSLYRVNENFQSADTDNIVMLLQETYTDGQIKASLDRISEVVNDCNNEIELRYRVYMIMKVNEFDATTDVPAIIRKIRPEFTKEDMKDVYHAIRVLQKYSGNMQ